MKDLRAGAQALGIRNTKRLTRDQLLNAIAHARWERLPERFKCPSGSSADQISQKDNHIMATDNYQNITETTETADEPTKSEEEVERERLNRRYALGRQIEERSRMISALLEQLVDPKTTKAEYGVIAGMIARNYISVLDVIPEYKELGGDQWGVDRGIFRHLFVD